MKTTLTNDSLEIDFSEIQLVRNKASHEFILLTNGDNTDEELFEGIIIQNINSRFLWKPLKSFFKANFEKLPSNIKVTIQND